MRSVLFLVPIAAACAADPDAVTVELAPDLVSSIDGTLTVHATVFAEREPAEGESVDLAVEYTDRNGTPHPISPVQGTTNAAGAFEVTLTGLTFDGTGTVTATLAGTQLAAAATFAVLDRTPPAVSITPPTMAVRPGNELSIAVHVTDEIGVSQVFFESTQGGQNRDRGTIIASGAADTTVSFDLQISENAAIGSTITVFALAADLSGNEAAAEPIELTVVP